MKKEKLEVIMSELDMVRTEIHEIENVLKDTKVELEIKGAICFKFIQCGKPRCHCMKGGSEHGPYPHLQWWHKGKIKTKYLNKKNYPTYKKELEKTKQVAKMIKKLGELKKTEKRLAGGRNNLNNGE